ncbi:hypothetical protein NQ317_016268, partial [Molorchus minor]
EVVNELHKPARKNFRRRHVIVKGLNDLIQADLVEIIPYAKNNGGNRYILVVINVFSKLVWAQPVKRKSGKDVTNAMKKFLVEMKIKPKNLQTDMGKEFYNKEFKNMMEELKINHYNTYSNLKASWLSVLPDIVRKYNDTIHRTTNRKPNSITEKDEKYLLRHAYSYLKTVDPRKQKFSVGDYVRISKYREAFSKGYTPNWSNEVFKILYKAQNTNPKTYLLEELFKYSLNNSRELASIYLYLCGHGGVTS